MTETQVKVSEGVENGLFLSLYGRNASALESRFSEVCICMFKVPPSPGGT